MPLVLIVIMMMMMMMMMVMMMITMIMIIMMIKMMMIKIMMMMITILMMTMMMMITMMMITMMMMTMMMVIFFVFLDPSSESWLGLTKHTKSAFKWSYSGDLISSVNWAAGEPSHSGITDDSGVVMDGTQNWSWKVVSKKTDLAQVICQRGRSEVEKETTYTECREGTTS